MTKQKDVRLYCFSPLVMITTFIIEIGAAFYTLVRYHTNTTARLIITMLGCLAFFQFAEYMVCKGAFLISSLDWARLGYVAITLLLPIGMHLGLHIAQKKSGILLKTAYASAAAFIAFFLFSGHGVQAEQCLGNYIIFSIAPQATIPYTIYYQGWLVTSVVLAWKAKSHITDVKRKQALKWLVVGYLSFMVPTLLLNILRPETRTAIPSIMCGFAILMAFCLLFKVAPLVLKRTDSEEYSF
jgi:hypothetical protein